MDKSTLGYIVGRALAKLSGSTLGAIIGYLAACFMYGKLLPAFSFPAIIGVSIGAVFRLIVSLILVIFINEEQEKVDKSFKEIQTKYIKNCDSADNNEIVGLFFAIMGGCTWCLLLLRLISIGRVALGLLSIVTFFGLPSFFLFINAKRLREDAKRLELKIKALNVENIQFGATGRSSFIIVGFASGIALLLMFVFRFSLFF